MAGQLYKSNPTLAGERCALPKIMKDDQRKCMIFFKMKDPIVCPNQCYITSIKLIDYE